VVPEGLQSVWAQYTIKLPEGGDRAAIQARMKDKGVPSAVYYAKPLHLQEAYSHHGIAGGALPVTDMLSGCVLSLPMHPYLDEETQDRVTDALISAHVWAERFRRAAFPSGVRASRRSQSFSFCQRVTTLLMKSGAQASGAVTGIMWPRSRQLSRKTDPCGCILRAMNIGIDRIASSAPHRMPPGVFRSALHSGPPAQAVRPVCAARSAEPLQTNVPGTRYPCAAAPGHERSCRHGFGRKDLATTLTFVRCQIG
jgi:hypothetical protein